MARKVLDLTIAETGRDAGKMFRLTEMSASASEKWAAKAFLALARSGVDIPDNISSAGLAGVAALGVKALGGMSFQDAEPLMDEMFRCVQRVTDPARPMFVRALIEDDIEEVATRLKIRMELFRLHVDFFTIGAPLISTPAAPDQAVTPNT